MTVAELFREARTRKGFTLEQTAQAARCSFSTVIRAENGQITPTGSTLFDLADVLGVSYEELRGALPSRLPEPTPA